MNPSSLDDLKEDPVNPREISPEAAAGLETSLAEFGDLSGIVFNTRTGQLVAGHQRVRQLKRRYGSLAIVDGEFVTPDGHAFSLRLVDWPPEMQRAANIAANSQAISGTFTPELEFLLEDLRDGDQALFDSLLFDQLLNAEPEENLAAVGVETQGRLDEKTRVKCPNCGHEF